MKHIKKQMRETVELKVWGEIGSLSEPWEQVDGQVEPRVLQHVWQGTHFIDWPRVSDQAVEDFRESMKRIERRTTLMHDDIGGHLAYGFVRRHAEDLLVDPNDPYGLNAQNWERMNWDIVSDQATEDLMNKP